MKKVLLDTIACVAFKRGDAGSVEIVRLADRLGVAVVSLSRPTSSLAIVNDRRQLQSAGRIICSP